MTFEEMQQTISDVLNRRPLTVQGPEAERFAEGVRRDEQVARDHGMVISFPQEITTEATPTEQ